MTSCAATAFKALNGVFVLYKPPRFGKTAIINLIKEKISRDLNKMEVRPVSSRVVIDGFLSKGENLTVKTVINYADHPLVVGPRYQMKDIKVFQVNNLDWFSSGVLPIGIGPSGVFNAMKLQNSNPIRSYELTGRLGLATDTYDSSNRGSVRSKSTYGHVTRAKLDAFLTKMQSNHQTLMYSIANVDINTQKAYDLASKGILKPASRKTTPIIYSVKCLEFDSPYFTVEIQCCNEFPVFLKRMVHEIGLGMKTNATCTRLRCTRFGRYTVDDSILPLQINLQNVLNSLEYYDFKQRGLRPVITNDLIDDLDPDYFDDPTENDTEILNDLKMMPFKFEKDADGYLDNDLSIADDTI